MPPIPYIPETAPFTPAQRFWLNGYIAGLISDAGVPRANTQGADAAPAKPLLILFGSQTGTAEGLARKLSCEAAKKGFHPAAGALDEISVDDLKQASLVAVITSTYGDGEPPDNAQKFWRWFQQSGTPNLDHLNYSVLALGDRTYPQFCEFGRQCDARFSELGARCVHPRVDCDVDYETPAAAWKAALLAEFAGVTPGPQGQDFGAQSPPLAESKWTKNHPFTSRLLENRRLTADGANKDVRHIALALDDPDLAYEPGDALGVFPQNDPTLVTEILAVLGCDGEEAIPLPSSETVSLRLALLQHFDVTKLSKEVSGFFRPEPGNPAGHDLLDMLQLFGVPSVPPAEWISKLRQLAPRLYSIASSPLAAPGEVHLTVGVVRYHFRDRARSGVCSTFLADRATGVGIPVFVHPTRTFKLPADASTPVVMAGPGTGIAPFRAFLQHRQLTRATGKNWLIFGGQTRAGHFLYREQIEQWQQGGLLTKLDLAFSRDQAEKRYVQHCILENAAELWRWLESGAHFYVCGDASRMAKDVDAALHQVCQLAGSLNPDAAAEYVEQLKKSKRYQRDVY
jgi:sulfite reductase (NADPH) flavoprotein alpha-component